MAEVISFRPKDEVMQYMEEMMKEMKIKKNSMLNEAIKKFYLDWQRNKAKKFSDKIAKKMGKDVNLAKEVHEWRMKH